MDEKEYDMWERAKLIEKRKAKIHDSKILKRLLSVAMYGDGTEEREKRKAKIHKTEILGTFVEGPIHEDSTVSQMAHSCTCEMNTLLIAGCQCGGI